MRRDTRRSVCRKLGKRALLRLVPGSRSFSTRSALRSDPASGLNGNPLLEKVVPENWSPFRTRSTDFNAGA